MFKVNNKNNNAVMVSSLWNMFPLSNKNSRKIFWLWTGKLYLGHVYSTLHITEKEANIFHAFFSKEHTNNHSKLSLTRIVSSHFTSS